MVALVSVNIMSGKRHRARALALKVLYEIDSTDHSPEDSLSWIVKDNNTPKDGEEFARSLVFGVSSSLDEIDKVISEIAPAYPLNQIAVMDRNILRLAIWEILFDNRVPMRAVISEAVQLAKHFGGDASPKFVNGVLGSVSLMTMRR